MGVRAGADGRKRGNPQPGTAHRNQRDIFSRLIGAGGAVLELADETEVVFFPSGNLFASGAKGNGSCFDVKRLVVIGPVAADDLEGRFRLSLVQEQAVVPGGGRVYLPGGPIIGAAGPDVLFADFQRVCKRAAADRDAVFVFRPFFERDIHRQIEDYAVAVFPAALDSDVPARRDLDLVRFPVNCQVELLAPAGDAQIKGKINGFRRLDSKDDLLVERVFGLFFNRNLCAVADLCSYGGWRVEYGGESVVRRGHP